jgi:Signal transduction histidine kinase regulating citrate/malate metabolism
MTLNAQRFSTVQITKMILIAFVDAVISGFYLKIFPFDYTINLAVVILPIYYYLDRRLVPAVTGIFIGSVGLIFRTLTGFYYYGSFANAFWADFNFLYFDLMYGIVFTILFFRNENKTLYTFFFAALAADFLGNAAEFISRFGVADYVSNSVMATLMLVAVIRATLAVVLISAIKYYNFFLRKEEHDERYRMQMNLLSELRGEMYFLKNNTEHVESVMDEAFSLYREYDGLTFEAQKTKALNIAKNVHEIKKNYFKVIEGIDEIILKETPFDMLKLMDLTKMLYLSTQRSIDNEHRNITLVFDVHSETQIHEHSMLMSVLRNLVNNAIEAIGNYGEIKLLHSEDQDKHYFIITDNGCGMTQDTLAYIFKPGFSTKYDDDTGNSNRGIGLSLVQDIVDKYFEGQIEVDSIIGVGTKFKLTIPKSKV